MGVVIFRNISLPRKTTVSQKFGVEVASVILVAGGVACELGAGFMIESKNIALRAIDIQLRSKNAELRSKSDQLLALVTEEAGDAKLSAASAKKSAAEADLIARGVSEQARILSLKLNALESKADDALGNVQRLWDQTLLIKKELDEEHARRLKLEANLAERTLPIVTGPGGNTTTLWPFHGLRVIIEYVPEPEAERAAGEICRFVKFGRLTCDPSDVAPNPNLSALYDGVMIEQYSALLAHGEVTPEQTLAIKRSGGAELALIAILKANDWKVRDVPLPGPLFGEPTEQNTIKVMIGIQPSASRNPLFRH